MKFIKTNNGNILNVSQISGFYIEGTRIKKAIDNQIKSVSIYGVYCWMNQIAVTYGGKKYSLKKEPLKFLIYEFPDREKAEKCINEMLQKLNKE